jgi:LysM repeat protein
MSSRTERVNRPAQIALVSETETTIVPLIMNIDSGSSMSNYVVTGLAIIGIALGGSALYVSMNGRSGAIQQGDRLSEVEQKIERLGGATEELQGQIRGLYNQTRTQLEDLANKVTTLSEASKPRVAAPVSGATEPAVSGQAAPPVPPTASDKTYTVRAGDFPSKIAKDHGVTLAALMKANPGLNPNKLKVGQAIKLP